MLQTPTFLPQSHIYQDPSVYQQPSAKFADLKRQTALISPSFLPLILAACGAGSGGGVTQVRLQSLCHLLRRICQCG